MADNLLTLADLVKINDQNLADLDMTDLLNDAPLLAALASDIASNGTSHKYTKESGAPVVGFRNPNEGRNHSKSSDTLVTIDLKILDASFHIDKALADAYTKGGATAMIGREARRHLRAGFFLAEQQFLYGTSNDADGFVGLAQATTLDGLTDDMVVDGGGSEATESHLTSVWMIRTNNDLVDMVAVTGQDGNIQIGESTVIMAEDGDGKKFPAYFTPITGWLGLQIGSIHSICRVANIDTAEGSTDVLTDDLLSMALERFPASRQPNLIVMHRKARGQLQRSRTATSPTGAGAPRPTEYEGIPIITSDAVRIDEDQVN